MKIMLVAELSFAILDVRKEMEQWFLTCMYFMVSLNSLK